MPDAGGGEPVARAGARAPGAVAIERIDVSAYTVPTESPEADGTIAWNSTTMVLVEAYAGGRKGLGYSYAAAAAGTLIRDTLADVVCGMDARAITAAWLAMVHAVRNIGRPGIASTAISAVDNALWDLKARLLDVPLAVLLGPARWAVPIYGSGGFTTYSIEQLQEQLAGWVREGIPRVKMKVGTDPARDAERVRAAREAIGPDAALYVDANGAYQCKQALAFAEAFAAYDVSWFEEPVPADDFEELHRIRDRAPAGMAIVSGEYGYEEIYFRRMLEAGAVDVMQADATRCGGITGFLQAASLCFAHGLQLSSHTAPALHVAPCCAVPVFRDLEYFYDHVRIENMFFEGVPQPKDGMLEPDMSRPGLGLELKRDVAEQYAVL